MRNLIRSHFYTRKAGHILPADASHPPSATSNPKLTNQTKVHVHNKDFQKSVFHLLRLPNELIFLIFSKIDDEDLYPVARSSRRLQYCALPIYFARHGISDPIKNQTRDVMVFDLTVNHSPAEDLGASATITAIKHLSCTFHFPQESLLWEFLSLECVLADLLHLDEVTLDLYDLYVWRMPGEYVSTKDAKWTQALSELLNAILAKSCTKLTVHQKHSPTETSRWVGPITAGSDPTPVRSVPHSALQKIRLLGTSIQPPAGTSRNSIKNLCIASSMLFYPPFVIWTINTLNTSSIIQLSLDSISLPSAGWSVVLPSIFVPSLSTLSITSCDITFDDLSLFLSRHSGITSLKLEQFDIVSSQHHLPTILPQLTTLSAPLDYVAHLLNHSGALPRLKSLSISLCVPIGSDLARMEQALAPVSHRIKQTDLSFRLFVHNNDASVLGGSWVGPCLQHATNLEVIGTWYHSYQGGSTYDVIGTWSRSYQDEFMWSIIVPAWLSRFSALERVSFTDFARMARAGQESLIHAIRETCVKIRAVTINGEEHSVRD